MYTFEFRMISIFHKSWVDSTLKIWMAGATRCDSSALQAPAQRLVREIWKKTSNAKTRQHGQMSKMENSLKWRCVD